MENSNRYSSSYCQDDGSTIRQRLDFKTPIAVTEEEDRSMSWKYLPRNVSNTSILTSIICVVAGSGMLGIPFALSQSGWIGMLFLIISACISHYTGCLIIRCLYLGPTTRLDGFPEVGYTTFGRTGQTIGFIFSQLLLFATPIVYFILASSNIADLLLSAGIRLDFKVCAWIVSVTVGFPFVMVRNMKDVSFMSLVATMASISLLLVISVVSTTDYHIDQDDGIHQIHHDIAIPRQFPMAFSTFSFSYCGNVIYPQLEGCMNQPQHWSKVMLVATTVITLMYVIIGFVCYLVYGDQVLNPVFLNIPHGYARNVAMIVATVHVLLASPLYLYVFTIRIESWLGLPCCDTMPENAKSSPSIPIHVPAEQVQSPPVILQDCYFQTPLFSPTEETAASVYGDSHGISDDKKSGVDSTCGGHINTKHYNNDDRNDDDDEDDCIISSGSSNINCQAEKGHATQDAGMPNEEDNNKKNTVYHYIVRRSVRFLEWLCNHPVLARVLLRSLEIAICALIAMLVPYFADVMNLIGTIAAELLTFVLPCVFFMKLSWQKHAHDKKLRRSLPVVLESLICASIALFGVFCISFGIVDSIAALTRDFQK